MNSKMISVTLLILVSVNLRVINAAPRADAGVAANAAASADVNINNNGCPPGPTGVKADAAAAAQANVTGGGPGGKTDASADAAAAAQVTGGGPGGKGGSQVDASASASASASAFGEEGCSHLNPMPCNGQLETVLVKTSWMLYMATNAQGEISIDTVACADRCFSQNCIAVRSKFTFSDGNFVQELWGTDGNQLMHLKQTLVVESKSFYIFKNQVQDVLKGNINDQNLSPCEQKDALIQSLQSSSFVVLGGELDQYIVFKTCCKERASVFVYITDDLYFKTTEELKPTFRGVDTVLYQHQIDNRDLTFLSQSFPGIYGCAKASASASASGSRDSVKADAKVDVQGGDGGGGAPGGGPPPPGGPCSPPPGQGGDVNGHAQADAKVDVKGGGPPGGPCSPPPGQGNDVNAHAQADAKVDVKGGGPPGGPCSPPPGQGDDVNAHAQADAKVDVKGGGGQGGGGNGGGQGGWQGGGQGDNNYWKGQWGQPPQGGGPCGPPPGQGGDVNVHAQADAKVDVKGGGPPGGPCSPPPAQGGDVNAHAQADAKVDVKGGGGQGSDVKANADAKAQVETNGGGDVKASADSNAQVKTNGGGDVKASADAAAQANVSN